MIYRDDDKKQTTKRIYSLFSPPPVLLCVMYDVYAGAVDDGTSMARRLNAYGAPTEYTSQPKPIYSVDWLLKI